MTASSLWAQAPLGTSFTYQGQLKSSGMPVDGSCDLKFTLYAFPAAGTAIAAPVCIDNAIIANGLITVPLDFGAVFDGNARWLEIAVRADTTLGNCGVGAFTTLSPRQLLSAVPYAARALSAPVGHSLDAADGSPANAVFVDNAGLVGVGTTTPGFPLSFPDTFGDKIALYRQSGPHFGFGIQNGGLFQIHTDFSASDIAFGYGSSAAFSEVMRIKGDGRVSIAAGPPNPTFGRLDVRAPSSSNAIYGQCGGQSGQATSPFAGVWGDSNVGTGVVGISSSGTGVWGLSSAANGYGVQGTNSSPTGYAGYFNGRVNVSGTLSKGGGSFKIDHPLDPENKYLYHSFVESPDMMNIYNGIVVTDGNGYATVTLPVWFDALNRDFRYQLTVIDAADTADFTQAKVVREIQGNQFTLRTSTPAARVSWQVTGIRQDAFANAHRIPVEEAKPADERGLYLYPKENGRPTERGVDFHRMERLLAPGASQ